MSRKDVASECVDEIEIVVRGTVSSCDVMLFTILPGPPM